MSIEFFDFKTETRKTIVKLDKTCWVGLALSPDDRYLLYSAIDDARSDLMMVGKFQ